MSGEDAERRRISYLQEVRSRLELEYECLVNRGEYALSMSIGATVEDLDAELDRRSRALGDREDEDPLGS